MLGDYVFQANNRAGLRILDIRDRANPQEVGYFDTVPSTGRGAWSVYPYFPSGTVVVSSVQEGVFIVKPTGSIRVAAEPEVPAAGFTVSPIHPNPFRTETGFTRSVPTTQHVTVSAYDLLGRRVVTVHEGTLSADSPHRITFSAEGLAGGVYSIWIETADGVVTRTAILSR